MKLSPARRSSPRPPAAERNPIRFPFAGRQGVPPEAISDSILSLTNETDIVLDPFSPDGGAAAEALKLNRRAVVIGSSSVSALFTEVRFRPLSLPRLRWDFEDVLAACRAPIAGLYATACTRCGRAGLINRIVRKNGKPVQIVFSCACSRNPLKKKPDPADLHAEEDISGPPIPYWHPESPDHLPEDAPEQPAASIRRRTIAALSIILHAIEALPESPTRRALKAAFASSLEAHVPAGRPPKNRNARPELAREENPWISFAACFDRLYQFKKESACVLRPAAVGQSFEELRSGRADIAVVDPASFSTGDGIPEASVDCIITALPVDPRGNDALAGIQAAWLRMNSDAAEFPGKQPPRGEAAQHRNLKLLAAFRSMRRAGKEGIRTRIFYADGCSPDLHEFLNLMEHSGLPAESLRHLPPGRSAGLSGGYVMQSRVQKSKIAPPQKIPEENLCRKLSAAARLRFAIHGKNTSAGKILYAFYRDLDGDEIAAVSKYPIEDLLARTVEPVARFRGGRLSFPAGRRKSPARKKIFESWRRILLDFESVAGGNIEAAETVRQSAVRRLSEEGLTAEDVLELRRQIRPAEIDRHRRVRTAGLLAVLGAALGYTSRTTGNPPDRIRWKTEAGRAVEYSLERGGIRVCHRRNGRTLADWGTLSYLDLERGLSAWQRRQPKIGAALAQKLVSIEDPDGAEETGPQDESSPARDLRWKVIENREICEGHFLLAVRPPKGYRLNFIPGQFFHLLCDPRQGNRRSHPLTLRRPFSIHRVRYAGFHRSALEWADQIPEEIRRTLVRTPDRIEFLYRVVGRGTEILSRARQGSILPAIGPCGNGFPIGPESTAVIVAGGIGIAPLAALAEELRYRGKEVLVYIGAVEKEMLQLAATAGSAAPAAGGGALREAIESEFREIGARLMTVCTDDGSAGERGLVTEMLEAGLRDGCVPREDVRLYACGPEGMLRATAEIAARHSLPCEVSLEERMACGIGACYSCTVTVRKPDGTPQKKRVCREGPVFNARDILWKD